MKNKRTLVIACIWFSLMVVGLNLPRGGFHLHLPVNTRTWCGSGPRPDYVLFTGTAFGYPFISHTIGDRERCTTLYRSTIELVHPGLELNLFLYGSLSVIIGCVVHEK